MNLQLLIFFSFKRILHGNFYECNTPVSKKLNAAFYKTNYPEGG